MGLLEKIFYNSLAIKCKNGLLGGSLIPSFVPKHVFRLCPKSDRFFTERGEPNPYFCHKSTFCNHSENGTSCGKPLQNLGSPERRRDAPSRHPHEPPYFFFAMASEILPRIAPMMYACGVFLASLALALRIAISPRGSSRTSCA